MKKIFSSIIALAMMMSLFTFNTAHAGTEGYYKVSYEAIGETDINNLEVDDMFWAVVELKNAEGIFSNDFGFEWDPAVLQLSTAAGAAATNFGAATANRFHQSVKVTTYDDEENFDYVQANAFDGDALVATSNSINYKFSGTVLKDDTGYTWTQDHLLETDITIVKVRFKVLSVGDPKFKFTSYDLVEVKADGATLIPRTNSSFDELKFASTGNETTYAPEYFSANLTYAKTAMDNNGMIQFTFEETTDAGTVDKYADYDFSEDFPSLESGTNLTLNIKVNDVPSTVTSLVLKGATWGTPQKRPAN